MVKRPPPECANCGASIPSSAKSCPSCGADERTGWRDSAASIYDGLDLPEDSVADEPNATERLRRQRSVNGIAWYWWCAGVALLMLLVLGALALR